MTTPKVYVVNLVLDLPIITAAADALERLRRMLFELPAGAFSGLNAAVTANSTMSAEAIAYYQKMSQQAGDEWARIARESTIEISGQTVILKVPFPDCFADYQEVSEDGRRPWLRQHIDDSLWYRLRNGLLDVRMELKCGFLKPEACPHGTLEEIAELEDAIKSALHRASQLRTNTFWIDGE